MSADRIKVLPNTDSAIGMKHPFDCPLDKDGSEWPYDSFTCRRLADESIRRAEIEPEAPAPAATTKAPKVKAPAEAAAADVAPADAAPAAAETPAA